MAMPENTWQVTSSTEGGLIVRTKKDLSSPQLPERLATGSEVKAVFYDDDSGRLRYQLLSGSGPASGWVSTRIGGKETMVRQGETPTEEAEKPRTVAKAPRRQSQPEDISRSVDLHVRAAPQIQLRASTAAARAPPSNLYGMAVVRPGKAPALSMDARQVARLSRATAVQQRDQVETAEDSDGERMHLCPQCSLPVGDFGYADNKQAYLHGECKAKLMLCEAKEDEEARQRRDAMLKKKERENYNIGWKVDLVPRNAVPASKFECNLATDGMCCLLLDKNSHMVRPVPTIDPAAAVNLEYLSIALQVRVLEGREPLFSLDAKGTPTGSNEPQDLWQVKRFEPAWLGGTSVGEVMFQADYHLKELSMGECEQPVLGMKSCFDLNKEAWHEKDWRAREWYVMKNAEIRMTQEGVLIPHVKMGVEAREQITGPDGVEDATITRPDHPLVRYAEAFTHHFDLIAERKSCVYHLRELAKASTLAKYLLDSQVDLEDSWFQLAQEVKGLYREEIPQLWNQRCHSQVQVKDGKILDAEKGMALGTRGVYGGVQFGLDKFDLGATTMQPGAREAPYSLLFSGVDRGAVVARGVATPPSLMEPRGVDLNLNKFDLSEAAPVAPEDLEHASLGKAFWSNVDGAAESKFKDADKALFKGIFNPHLSDRRDEGDRFMPPDVRAGHMEGLRKLVKEEEAVRQRRKEHFLSKDFVAGNAGPLFPSSWTHNFELSGASARAAGLLQANPEQDLVERVLKAASPAFDRTTEDGARFRVYRLDGVELRTTQEHDGEEVVGAVYSSRPDVRDEASTQVDDAEQIVKVIEYVERIQEAGKQSRPSPAQRRFYVVFETDKGSAITTERRPDGTVMWAENPQDLEARNALARVTRSADCCGRGVSVRDARAYCSKATLPGVRASHSECKRYAHGACDLAAKAA